LTHHLEPLEVGWLAKAALLPGGLTALAPFMQKTASSPQNSKGAIMRKLFLAAIASAATISGASAAPQAPPDVTLVCVIELVNLVPPVDKRPDVLEIWFKPPRVSWDHGATFARAEISEKEIRFTDAHTVGIPDGTMKVTIEGDTRIDRTTGVFVGKSHASVTPNSMLPLPDQVLTGRCSLAPPRMF
jgi:hypothetical protein